MKKFLKRRALLIKYSRPSHRTDKAPKSYTLRTLTASDCISSQYGIVQQQYLLPSKGRLVPGSQGQAQAPTTAEGPRAEEAVCREQSGS